MPGARLFDRLARAVTVQEAVLAIHLKRNTYDPDEPLTPWVHAIARYKLVDFLRRTRASFADVPIEEADEIMAHDDHDAAESSYDIRRLMERLPKNMQCAVEAVKLDGLSTADPDVAVDTAVRLGFHADLVREGLQDPAIKQRVIAANEQAIATGVFGSPFIMVDGEPFWGSDRLGEVARRLAA